MNTTRKITYDQKSYELAEYFLSDSIVPVTPADIDSLAQVIQQAIEDWLQEFESRK